MEKLKVASLFSGCGGTDLGMHGGFKFGGRSYKRLNTEVVYANDIEKTACDIFNENFNLKADNRDIRNVEIDEIPDFDILTGGFPCQSFSVVAQNPKRLGVKDNNGKLFFEMIRILERKKPISFIAENVKGILSANQGEAFPLIIKSFEDAGYIVRHKIIKAVEFGIPQKRERVIIVGIRKDYDVEFDFPEPIITRSEEYMPLKKILEKDVPDKYYFSERAVIGMMKNQKKMNKGRAQDPNYPCNTVGAHLAKVSLNSTDPVFYENGKYRRFTPREVARIQSFPENFKLKGSEGAQYRALGNAIPPVLLWHIAKKLQEVIESVKVSNIEVVDVAI